MGKIGMVIMRRGITGLLLSCMAMTAAVAQNGEKAAVPARAAACAACHGKDGNSTIANIPSLAGQPQVFLEQQLIVIREGLRVIPAMQGLLDGVPDEEITALAQYYADLPVSPPTSSRREEQFARGKTLADTKQCASCHLPSYAGREQMPRLAGQREDYLVHSMREFHRGTAVGRDTVMAGALYGLSDQDLQDLAHYLANVK